MRDELKKKYLDQILLKKDKDTASRLQDLAAKFKKKGLDKQSELFQRDPQMKGKTVYHGTPRIFEGQDIKPSEAGLMGQGIYTTDNPAVAKTYSGEGGRTNPLQMAQRGRPAQSPSVKSFKLSKDINLLDMQAELGEKERELFNKYIREMVSENNMDMYEIKKGEKGYQAMKDLQNAIEDSGSYTYEGTDIFDSLAYDMKQELGYDGLSHQGGVATKNKPHNVAVIFDPDREGLDKLGKMKVKKSHIPFTTPEGQLLPPKIKTPSIKDIKSKAAKKVLKLGKKGLKALPFVGPAMGAYFAMRGDAQAATDVLDPSGSTSANLPTPESIEYTRAKATHNARLKIIELNKY